LERLLRRELHGFPFRALASYLFTGGARLPERVGG